MTTADQAQPSAGAMLLRRPRVTPVRALLGGVFLLALLAGLVAANVTHWALDETEIEASAVHYTSDFPNSLLHDPHARATNRLYSLILSIAFRLFDTPTAVIVDHVLSVVLFLSAAVPIYLLARRLLRSEPAAVVVALLSVAVPWLTLSTALFTENLSYPLFWWVMLIAGWALWRPGMRRDAFALLAIALLVVTRVQFASMFVGYALAAIAVAVLRWRVATPRPRARQELRRLIAGFPFSSALIGLAIIVVIYLRVSGKWAADVSSALGGYSNVVISHSLPPNMVEAMLVELIAMAVGIGLLPVIVSLVWSLKRLARPSLDERYVYLLGGTILLAVFLILTDYSQFGYIGPVTEERYWFYVVPAFWLGTAAALRDRVVRPGELLLCAVALAAVFGSIPFLSPLTNETAFLAPAQSVVQHVLVNRLTQLGIGLSVQDALALIAGVAGVAAALLWMRRPLIRARWIFAIAASVQLLVVGYAYAVLTNNVPGIEGRTGGDVAALGWIDAHTRTGQVTWLQNLSVVAPPSITDEDQQRTTQFWNQSVTNWLSLSATGLPAPQFPMSSLPGNGSETLDVTTGALAPTAPLASTRDVVQGVGSPFLQLHGRVIARSPGGGLEMIDAAMPVRADWFAQGLGPDGSVLGGAPAHLYAFAAPSATAQRLTLVLGFGPPPAAIPPATDQPTHLGLKLGRASRTITLTPGAATGSSVTLSVCLRAGQRRVEGMLAPDHAVAHGVSSGALGSVAITATPAPGCRG